MLKLIAAAALSTALTGCVLAPNEIRPDIRHDSHTSQHEPFTSHPTNMGAESINVTAEWRLGHTFVDVSEGYNISPGDGQVCNGGICGPRELFSASIGYIFEVKP